MNIWKSAVGHFGWELTKIETHSRCNMHQMIPSREDISNVFSERSNIHQLEWVSCSAICHIICTRLIARNAFHGAGINRATDTDINEIHVKTCQYAREHGADAIKKMHAFGNLAWIAAFEEKRRRTSNSIRKIYQHLLFETERIYTVFHASDHKVRRTSEGRGGGLLNLHSPCKVTAYLSVLSNNLITGCATHLRYLISWWSLVSNMVQQRGAAMALALKLFLLLHSGNTLGGNRVYLQFVN